MKTYRDRSLPATKRVKLSFGAVVPPVRLYRRCGRTARLGGSGKQNRVARLPPHRDLGAGSEPGPFNFVVLFDNLYLGTIVEPYGRPSALAKINLRLDLAR